MRILNRYIRYSVIEATLLVMLVLLGIECFMEFIVQLPDIGHANFGIKQAFLYVLGVLPADLYQLFPMAGFLGCLIGLGRLASSHQLVVMRTAGMSVGEITWSVIKAALIMIVIGTFIGEFVAPKLEAKAQQEKAKLMSMATGFKTLGGVWLREDSAFIHIGAVDSNHEISDITRFEINKQHVLLSADYASKGAFVGGHWELYNVESSKFSLQQVKRVLTPVMPLQVVFDPTLMQMGKISIDQQSIAELYHSVLYRQSIGIEVSQYVFAFWQRVIQPFTTVVMICLGIPFIFAWLI